ncbi:toll-like receptor Tollo isoform X1 [Cylas formicarius]|uniref:toll-like receptor Tollo isoform X1 n=2 Tax=Cylas formicarius TaxID=197179 RepID=UPI002958A231|nr:toll-like receptor Tollo isoform X1 [Cylas formicarius]XP_060534854.1 toll-like receptor Tollo isoform X1 [Cylas formicarius]XP_060534862.1 toll-like receptor Tollo isoform X1 [Cylas formicarius]
MATSRGFFTAVILTIYATAEYIPPGPLYRCPNEPLLLHPCTCDAETDQGLYVSCNNTNLASMGVALNNLATFELPVERLILNGCHMARLFGGLLHKLKLRTLLIENTPIETIDRYSFLGVNDTLNELHLVNSSLTEFPSMAFKILGNLTVLNIDGHNMTQLPLDAFADSDLAGRLLKLHVVNGQLDTPAVESLQPLRKLKTLDLHGNDLKALKRNQFKGLRDVEVLDLSFNSIPKIDSTHLGDLTKMSFLNVSHNQLTELTRGAFARNTVLRVLNMSFNKIKKLDTNSFRGMRFLRRLYLSDNLISDVGRGTFGSLQRIGTIDLARNLIRKIDYQMFYQLNLIEVIDVSENNVTEIQKLAFKDVYLTNIDLSRNNISKIEIGAFENCANITRLDLSYNQLRSLPKKAFDETTYATELQFSYNFFTSLDQIPLHNMSGLKILNVSHNLIESIPKKTFPKLYELHTIDLAHNNLSDIFNAVFQTLFSLRYLNMSHNSLQSIKPSTFGPVPTLLYLDMSYNRLENIAKSALTRLASMRDLILRGNKLTSLFILPISTSSLDLSHNEFAELPPKQWPSMNSLLSLDLSHNNLRDNLVHGSFGNLLTLQRLNLNYNGATRPPWAPISELTSLQYLYLKGNNLTKLERNAFGKMPTMFELDLEDNNVNNVTARAFEGLLQLIRLNLNNNNLTVIPNGAFQGLVALNTLDLSQNRLVKLDNKTHGVFEDCLSLERLNLSHNKITFLTRKMFPSNPYIPYRLREIDLSHNYIPVITHDLLFGTSKLERLDLSHNAIADLRKGVIGNLSMLTSLDLSANQLHDLTSEPQLFRLPRNISVLRLGGNELTELPWHHVLNATQLSVLDVRDNRIPEFGPEMTELAVRGVDVMYQGNPLRCDCLLRPLIRHFSRQLHLKEFYKAIRCSSPAPLAGSSLYELPEERLVCPPNVNTTIMLEGMAADDYGVLPDLKFRELTLKKNMLRMKWRVMKNEDIADVYLVVRNANSPLEVLYQTTLSYSQRKFETVVADQLRSNDVLHNTYQLCLLAKNSKDAVRKFYGEQCRDLDGSALSGGGNRVEPYLSVVLVVAIVFVGRGFVD